VALILSSFFVSLVISEKKTCYQVSRVNRRKRKKRSFNSKSRGNASLSLKKKQFGFTSWPEVILDQGQKWLDESSGHGVSGSNPPDEKRTFFGKLLRVYGCIKRKVKMLRVRRNCGRVVPGSVTLRQYLRRRLSA